MIESEKSGRCNYIQLSESGSRVAKHLAEIKEEFRNNRNTNNQKKKSKRQNQTIQIVFPAVAYMFLGSGFYALLIMRI